MLKVQVAIPDTDSAREALNYNVQKILKAHGAQGNDYFQVIEESKEGAKKPRKPRAANKKQDASPGDEVSTEAEQVQP